MKKINSIMAVGFILFIYVVGIGTGLNLIRAQLGYISIDNKDFARDGLGEKINSIIMGQEYYKDILGSFARITGQPQLNGITKLNNGYLTAVCGKADSQYMEQCAEWLSELDKYLISHEKRFLYVQAPYKVCKFDNQLPAGIEDYSNENIDLFLKKLDERNVFFIDIRDELYKDKMNQYDFFYVTDHHWNIEGGYYTFLKIQEYIEKELCVTVDDIILSKDNYQLDIYPESYLGWRGRQSAETYAGIDDFELMHPLFDTYFYNKETGKSGTFDDMCLNYAFLNNKISFYNIYGGEDACTELYNPMAKNKMKILIGGDSFIFTIVPFMQIAYENVKSQYACPPFSKEMIDEYDPDIVILVNWGANIPSKYYYCEGLDE